MFQENLRIWCLQLPIRRRQLFNLVELQTMQNQELWRYRRQLRIRRCEHRRQLHGSRDQDRLPEENLHHQSRWHMPVRQQHHPRQLLLPNSRRLLQTPLCVRCLQPFVGSKSDQLHWKLHLWYRGQTLLQTCLQYHWRVPVCHSGLGKLCLGRRCDHQVLHEALLFSRYLQIPIQR